jgi:hypothetical protein
VQKVGIKIKPEYINKLIGRWGLSKCEMENYMHIEFQKYENGKVYYWLTVYINQDSRDEQKEIRKNLTAKGLTARLQQDCVLHRSNPAVLIENLSISAIDPKEITKQLYEYIKKDPDYSKGVDV